MALNRWSLVLLAIFYSQVDGQEAILHVSSGSTFREYCLVYNSSWSNISDSLSSAVSSPLLDLHNSDLCSPDQGPPSLRNRSVLVMKGSCDLTRSALVAQNLGAVALLVASKQNLGVPSSNDSEYSKVQIPVVLLRDRDALDALQVFPGGMQVQLYAPPLPLFDDSTIVLLIIAVFTVAVGGYWSGAAEKERMAADMLVDSPEERSDDGELSLYSPVKVMLFVGMMCLMLVLMYFFYRWLVYAFIVIFCVASASAMYNCLQSLLTASGCGALSVSCGERTVSLRSLFVAAVCITLSVIWGVYRNDERWIWILQDLLGIAFCLNFLKTVSLSNFKVSERASE
ncbi:hypothetical protein DNTS_024162 [Danionella cerebrum]|uniref:PA domain-containing protein n=1 Tax=Danionella cerebrum TaxID=2873325 RepID=A0A553RII4_9TELE|nr:hypothetical protein DNTS_024162 [Danionella translucida]